MKRGKFIVLEGVDGAGTTTHAQLLCQKLNKTGEQAIMTHEPTAGPIGTMIRQILSGRLRATNGVEPIHFDWKTMALLFAADRIDHVQCEIQPTLARGVHVISDRYVYSSLAYQACTAAIDEDSAAAWISEINRHALAPDICLLFDVSAENAAARRAKRDESEELYEKDELQRRLVDAYKKLPTQLQEHRFKSINANGPLESTFEQVWTHASSLL